MNFFMRHWLPLWVLLLCFTSTPATASELSSKDEVLFSKAQALNNLKRFEESRQDLESLYHQYPDERKIAIEYAKALGYTRQPDLALQILNKLDSGSFHNPEIFEIRLAILESHQRFDEALQVCAKALAEDPDSSYLTEKMAQLQDWTGHYEQAISLYEKLSLKEPQEKHWQLNLADVHFAAGHYEKAISLYESMDLRNPMDFERLRHLGYAYHQLSKTNQSIQIFKEILEAHPDHFQVALDLCYFLNQTHQNEEANQLLDKLLRFAEKSEEHQLQLAIMLASYGRYENANALLRKILTKNPNHTEALLWLARLGSWQKKYPDALAAYDRLIALDSAAPIPRKEKARVLGWTRHYRSALTEYQKLYRDTHDQAIFWEWKSKKAFYEDHPLSALHHYGQWLALEPDDLEALFDLSQVEAQLKQWNHARQHLEKILQKAPMHERALASLRTLDIKSKKTVLVSSYEFREGDSGQRSVDYRIHGNLESFTLPVRENLDLQLTQALRFHDTAWKAFIRNQSGVQMEFRPAPFFKASGGYAYEVMGGHLPDGQYFFEKLDWNPLDVLRLQATHHREAVLDNPDVIRRAIRTDDFDGRVFLSPTRRLTADAGYRYSHRTDSNERREWSQGIKYALTMEPKRLSVSYRYETYGFDDATDLYFSPDSFHTQIVALEFRHYLNKEELFWGSKDTYYELKYAVNFDSGIHEGHRLSIAFYKDWTDFFTTSVGWSCTLYDDPRIYRESNLDVRANIAF